MLTKNWNTKTGRFDVTFDLPAELDIEQAAVVGEFNDWSETADPMSKGGDGSWSATVSLDPSRTFRFRYHLGNDRWENDWSADSYVGNDFGGADSVVMTPEEPVAPPPAKSAAPKKAAAKKAPAKKSGGAKQAPAKKSAAAKAPAEKPAADKPAAKKASRGGAGKPAKKAKKAARKATKRPSA